MALDLGKQVGPLPLGAWIVVVGGGLGVAYYTKTHPSAAPDPSIDTSGQAGVGDGTVGGWTPTSPSTGGTTEAPKPTTNEEWAYAAKTALIAMGYPTTTVNSAMDKYINGLAISMQEYAMVAIALAKVGPLPSTLPTGPVGPTPDPKPVQEYPAASTAGVKPASGSHRGYGWYKVVKGDSATSIANKYKIPILLYYAYNGPARIVAGQYVKVRLTSNPVTGPYYGR